MQPIWDAENDKVVEATNAFEPGLKDSEDALCLKCIEEKPQSLCNSITLYNKFKSSAYDQQPATDFSGPNTYVWQTAEECTEGWEIGNTLHLNIVEFSELTGYKVFLDDDPWEANCP